MIMATAGAWRRAQPTAMTTTIPLRSQALRPRSRLALHLRICIHDVPQNHQRRHRAMLDHQPRRGDPMPSQCRKVTSLFLAETFRLLGDQSD